MKYTLGIVAGALLSLNGTFAASIIDENDVIAVYGSGDNRSTLVFDFNDGTINEHFAWGFLWDDPGTSGQDMLDAIVAGTGGDLVLDSSSYISFASYDDGSLVHSQTADFGNSLYWSYYISGGFAGDDNPSPDFSTENGGNPVSFPDTAPTGWAFSPTGPAAFGFGDPGRILADGSWDAWSYGSGGVTIPEPSALLLSLSGLALLIVRRRR